jgi:hypothetical protein
MHRCGKTSGKARHGSLGVEEVTGWHQRPCLKASWSRAALFYTVLCEKSWMVSWMCLGQENKPTQGRIGNV